MMRLVLWQRSLYWKYADKEFFANDFDAWWCDCTEPLDADWKKLIMIPEIKKSVGKTMSGY